MATLDALTSAVFGHTLSLLSYIQLGRMESVSRRMRAIVREALVRPVAARFGVRPLVPRLGALYLYQVDMSRRAGGIAVEESSGLLVADGSSCRSFVRHDDAFTDVLGRPRHQRRADRCSPFRVRNLRLLKIRLVACGMGSAFASGEHGGMWSWGWNDRGQLGLGDIHVRRTPCRIPGIAAAPSSIGAHGTEALAVVGGHLFVWGDRHQGADDPRCMVPERVSFMTESRSGPPLVAASLGNWGVAIDADGALWSWATPNYQVEADDAATAAPDGEEGDDAAAAAEANNAVIDGLRSRLMRVPKFCRQPIIQVSTTHDHCLILSATGAVYGYGCNTYNQVTAHRRPDQVIQHPHPVPGLPSRSVFVHAGFEASFVVTDSGGPLFTWGSAYGGQLGLNSNAHHSDPTAVEAIPSADRVGGSAAGMVAATVKRTTTTTDGTETKPEFYTWGATFLYVAEVQSPFILEPQRIVVPADPATDDLDGDRQLPDEIESIPCDNDGAFLQTFTWPRFLINLPSG